MLLGFKLKKKSFVGEENDSQRGRIVRNFLLKSTQTSKKKNFTLNPESSWYINMLIHHGLHLRDIFQFAWNSS